MVLPAEPQTFASLPVGYSAYIAPENPGSYPATPASTDTCIWQPCNPLHADLLLSRGYCDNVQGRVIVSTEPKTSGTFAP